MTSATDIITYVGVPLAVVGVLPILYTLIRALLTLRSIRNTLLRHGHVPTSSTRPDGFTTRSSPMTSLIEVDLPRYTIAPLDRSDPDYWRLDASSFAGDRHALLRAESTLSMVEEGRVQGFLRGGSWRTFHWKKLVVGRKLYRIQWEDELREPPAEIDFSDLVHFLMDWGAVPNAGGWEKFEAWGSVDSGRHHTPSKRRRQIGKGGPGLGFADKCSRRKRRSAQSFRPMEYPGRPWRKRPRSHELASRLGKIATTGERSVQRSD